MKKRWRKKKLAERFKRGGVSVLSACSLVLSFTVLIIIVLIAAVIT